jgi:hypothetical protein
MQMFTAEEILQLLPLALDAFGEGSALVQKLRGMSGQGDAELLAAASAADQAAQQEIAADKASE